MRTWIWYIFCIFPISSGFAFQGSETSIHEVKAAYKETVFSGFTRARAEVTLVSEVAGRAERVYLDVGQTLGEDGHFAQLDSTFLTLDLEQNRNQQAQLQNRLAYLSLEVDRFKNLVEKQTIAQSTFDEMVNRLDQARLELAVLKTGEKILEERLKRFTLKGTAGWRVITRNIEPGQWVNTGSMVARLGDYRSLYAPFALDARTCAVLQQTENLTLSLPEFNTTVPARIARISPDYDPQTRKIAVDLEISGGLPEMRGGLRVTLGLNLQNGTPELLVPDGALVQRYDDWWVTLEDGESLRVRVLGQGPEGMKRIAAGQLKAGDRIVVNKP